MEGEALVLDARPLEDGSGWELLSPGVGLYADAPAAGSLKGPGQPAGCLVVLDRPHALLLPEGVAGTVATPPPERRHLPVGFGQVLFQVRAAAAEAVTGLPAAGPRAEGQAGPVVRAEQAGRFWRRPDPGAPEFAAPGDELAPGRTLGLLEVMKTFNPVRYQPGAGLPEQARLRRFLVDDGAEVEEGQALAEVEPVP